MAYVLVSVSSEGVTLLTAEPFETRQEALSSLQSLLDGPAADVIQAGETRLVDLDAAAPVLLVAAPTPQGAVADDTQDVPDEIASDVSDVAADESESVVVEVEEMPVPDPEDVPPAPPVVVATSAEPEVIVEPEPEDEPEVIVEPEPEDEPEDEPEAIEVPDESDSAEDASLVAALQAAAEQLVAEGIPAPEAVGEDVAEPPPTEDIESVSSAEAAPETEKRSWPWEIESGEGGSEPAEVDDELAEAAGEVEEVMPEPAPAPEQLEPPAVIEPDAEGGYEPGAVDMETYSCDDCVYEATCPKKGDETPATCGSFQWRSS